MTSCGTTVSRSTTEGRADSLLIRILSTHVTATPESWDRGSCPCPGSSQAEGKGPQVWERTASSLSTAAQWGASIAVTGLTSYALAGCLLKSSSTTWWGLQALGDMSFLSTSWLCHSCSFWAPWGGRKDTRFGVRWPAFNSYQLSNFEGLLTLSVLEFLKWICQYYPSEE